MHQDPSSSSCTTTFSSASSLPSVVAGKCEAATCSGLASCMTDPTSTSCTTTYGAATALPAVLAGTWHGMLHSVPFFFTYSAKLHFIPFLER